MGITLSGISGLTNFNRIIPIRPSAENIWTVAFLPDTQRLIHLGYQSEAYAMAQYVADNIESKNIKAVFHLGDICEDGSAGDYAIASTMLTTLKTAGIPFIPCLGNHDYDDNFTPPNRLTTRFNTYLPLSDFSNKSWFGGNYPSGKMDNNYMLQEIAGETWMFMSLEMFPNDADVAWANSVITSEAPDRVILATHGYLGYEYESEFDESGAPYDGKRIVAGDDIFGYTTSLDSSYPGVYNSGQDLWENLINLHSNIIFVHSAHILDTRHQPADTPSGTNYSVGHSVKVDMRQDGSICNQVVHNHQNDIVTSGNTASNIRFYQFDSLLKTITSYSYAPTLSASPADIMDNYPTQNPDWHARHNYSLNY